MNEMAISTVIGIILMMASTIVIAGTMVIVLGGFALSDTSQYAIISISDAVGGLRPGTTFENNLIRMLHRGGNMLCVNETMVIMQGYGQAEGDGIGFKGV